MNPKRGAIHASTSSSRSMRHSGGWERGSWKRAKARTVTIARSYETSVEDLWDACTNAERIPRWFLPVSGELRLGGRYQLEGNAGGKIESCDPPHRFSTTWEYGGSMGWIEVRLSTQDDTHTLFELEHISLVEGGGYWDRFGPGATGVGWDLALVGLALHLAVGSGMDPREVAALERVGGRRAVHLLECPELV